MRGCGMVDLVVAASLNSSFRRPRSSFQALEALNSWWFQGNLLSAAQGITLRKSPREEAMALGSAKCVLVGVFLALLTASLGSTESCPPWQRNSISHAYFHSNGSVEDLDTNDLYPPNTYWTEMENGTGRTYGCPCKLGKPCLRKCCSWDQAMDNVTLECTPHHREQHWFRPNVTVDPEFRMYQVAQEHQFRIVYGNYCWGYLLEPFNYKEDMFYINFSDATLFMPLYKMFALDTSSYCLEYIPQFDEYLPYVCFSQLGLTTADDICNSLRYNIYPLGMVISIIFLIISLVIYSTTAELRNLHGKCLMCHIVSLLVAYLFLAIVQSSGGTLGDDGCTAFGFVIYFAFLCTFFWLNIMCIDIYVTFSTFTPPTIHKSETKKFLSYVAYAWGLPLVIIIVTAIMEFHPGISDSFLKPEFKNTCWFNSKESRMAYFIAPVGVIVVCNIILFVLTAFNIHKVKRETSILQRGSSSKSKEDKNRMKLYIKLSIVMGVSWVLEILSYIVGGSKCIWLVTDTLNTLQGLFIFLIFVCKRNVKDIMKPRLRRLISKIGIALISSTDSNVEQEVDVE